MNGTSKMINLSEQLRSWRHVVWETAMQKCIFQLDDDIHCFQKMRSMPDAVIYLTFPVIIINHKAL